MTSSFRPLLIAGLIVILCAAERATAAESPTTVDFAQEIQPILRRNCYRCHGSKNQEGGLQLNRRSGVMGEADSGEPVVVKHDADASLLIQRIVNDDNGDLMPPDSDPLPRSELNLLKRWIDEGAVWPDALAEATHWAYQPVRRPELPSVGLPSVGPSDVELPADETPGDQVNRSTGAIESPIDLFIARRLRQRGLWFTQPLDRPRLLRRVSLALVGLPPTPDQVSEFVDDDSDDAYEKAVDQLLHSPRYGERWAVPWLDLARYADSNGFQADQIRDNWAYRDWVIRAMNDGMPFDQFVIDQIAGDLRAGATTDQKIATGFHRMTTCNVEAGVHPEANRVNQVIDRVNTTGMVFLGTTLECAQCHDHKYDPFTQQDYYQLFAFFNNTPLEVKNKSGVTWDFYGPAMDLPMEEKREQSLASLGEDLAELERSRQEMTGASDEEFEDWMSGLRRSADRRWQSVVPEKFESTADEEYTIQEDGAVLLSGSVPDTVEHIFTLTPKAQRITAIRVDVLTDESIPGKGPGRGDAKRSNIILSEVSCELQTDQGSASLELQDPAADFSQTKWPVASAIDGDRKTGWAIAPEFGKPHWASFVLAKPIEFVPGKHRLRVTLSQFFGRGRVIGKPRVSVYSGDTSYLNLDPKVLGLAKKKKWSGADRKKLRAEFDKNNPRLRAIDRGIARVKTEMDRVKPATTLVMVEMDKPRETFVMIRGDYENLGQPVQPGTPAALSQSSGAIPPSGDRMELARWLTARENPLLARVTVNRWWAELMGTGLVETLEDFGSQGEDPSHPALLDWLASELMDSGWSMKHIHKSIVMSRTFRQSARVTPELLEIDPRNRLLARGPRFRLSAELIRDNALEISGLLSDKMYGPPIMPYQPNDVWRSVGRNQPKWIAAENEDRFRRGAYVVWKRAAPYPSFINFDAPDRGSCTVNRGRSNTPLQALTLLNDPAYAEMSLALADRILSQSTSSDDQSRIDHGITLALRGASDREIDVLNNLLNSERETLRKNPSLVAERTRLPFSSMTLRSQDRDELAAWFAIANVLLNLDETMSP